ncbi:hypothetical protein [Enterococcus pallens]|uniref:Uncharacterized protein n=1 Tax=Enterococcus pallens ATCC BAA-351 TaxID=1158607 RepID=R2SLJ8_9ENTE|nr:hypothetical protein [Enterococcus pallens]EOH96005.1 hypothetical protein UAU_01100 [Enterococcus pallens ATCC BAA-351]EOU14730.1 hypothetical protein I588_04380 [Enterococcus pallens ATCC BAA-351]
MGNTVRDIQGKWLIQASNFPMWLSGKRLNPSITYQAIPNEPEKLLDLVEYQKQNGKQKSIVGIDTIVSKGFEWRGKGLLKVLRSHWSVAGMNEKLLVIRFEASLVTPAGVDVLVRSGEQKNTDLKEILANSLEELGITAAEFDSLTWL